MGGTKPQEQVLDLRSIFGLTARVTVPAAEAGGRYVEMDCTVEPGSGTDLHIHPEQEERYEVLEGALEVFLDGRWHPVPSGESFSVPTGAVHAFRNRGETRARFLNRHAPAYGFQAHLETLDRLVRAGKIRGWKDPRSLMYMSMSVLEHRPSVSVKPPQWIVNLLGRAGRRLGYKLDA
jgi:mannose-6-phosphate isomerase-like protein (cupin superfamily)